jgi:hypothetical protein
MKVVNVVAPRFELARQSHISRNFSVFSGRGFEEAEIPDGAPEWAATPGQVGSELGQLLLVERIQRRYVLGCIHWGDSQKEGCQPHNCGWQP